MDELVPADSLALVRADPGDLQVHPAAVHLAAQSTRARPGVLSSLRTATRVLTADAVEDPLLLDWAQVGFQHIAALLAALQAEGRKPAGINHIRSCVTGVLKVAWQLGQIDSDRYLRAKSVRRARGTALPAGREVERSELYALMKVCADDPSAAGRRDAAILALLFGAGLRRSTLVLVCREHYDEPTGALKVRAKGNKELLVYVTGGARQVLRDWLDRRGDGPGPLFPPISQKGELGVGGISSHAVYKICLKRAKEAAVRGFAPHDARRTFVTQLLEAGADLAAVADLAGHSNVNTTRRYDRRGERAKLAAAERVFVPYVAPSNPPNHGCDPACGS